MKYIKILLVITLCSTLLCGCNNHIEESPEKIDIIESHITYYQKDNGNTVIDNKGNDNQSDLMGIGFANITARWYPLETKEIEEHGEKLYQMLLYAEVENGFMFKFDEMSIKDIDFYNDNYENDGKFVDGSQIALSTDEDINRYLITLACSEPFKISDVNLYAYNESNENYLIGQLALINNMDMNQTNLHQTFPTTTQFVSIGGDYYVISQGIGRKYLESESDMVKIAITEEAILWCSENGSVEKLFNLIIENHKWANSLNEKPFDSEATLEIVEDEELGICLVKTAKYGTDDITANPSRIVYEENGDAIYISII